MLLYFLLKRDKLLYQKFLSTNSVLSKLKNSVDNYQNITVFGFNRNEKMWLMSETDSFVCYVVATAKQAAEVKESLIAAGRRVASWLCPLSFSYSNFESAEFAELKQIFNNLVCGELDALVLVASTILTRLPSPQEFKNGQLILQQNETINLKTLKQKLILMGFKRVEKIENQYEFRSVGDVLDISIVNETEFFRVSFFDDEIEEITLLNKNSYEVVKKVSKIVVPNFNLIDMSTINIDEISKCFNNGMSQKFLKPDAKVDLEKITSQILVDLQSGKLPEFLLPYFEFKNSIFSYLPENAHIIFDETKQLADEIKVYINETNQNYESNLLAGLCLKFHEKSNFMSISELNLQNLKGLISFQQLINANVFFKPDAVFNMKTGTLVHYLTNKQAFYLDLKTYANLNYTILLFAKNNELAKVLETELNRNGLQYFECQSVSMAQKNTLNVITKFEANSACFMEDKLLVVGTPEFLKQPKAVEHTKQNSNFESFFTLPKTGDFVVHHIHGIGKCNKIVSMTFNNLTKDYIEIEYKNQDKLFLPVENLDSVTKYIGKEHPTLNKLGGTEFAKQKQSVKASLKKLTFNLKQLYKARLEKKGIAFAYDDELQTSFENSFAFDETPDQIKAIQEMKSDMQSSRVMDRLICGDVGFGKTEVALRGIFKAVVSGCQVMFLCPTTILSMQHYNTCISRMKDFGVRVEVLNRFKTMTEQKSILKDLTEGNVDVLIGTHRILSKDVEFKNLGLLVLDEEQKFGVEHKEKIKNIKNNIDVLTLSATPIPRTMNMSLVGIKDISVIATPPVARIPVITRVVAFEPETVKNAINNELGRGGQCLIIHNRVQNIYEVAKEINDLCGSEVTVGVAHGQMPQQMLEDEILKLYQGKTQILVSTTLIENGVDLPNANTLIVLDADKLGLSQLYQLKGRVGRSERQAYAYFMYDKRKVLSEEGYKRLEAIMEFSGLGNGFKIAMRDLEIRGAGSVFGGEQSGHMEKVGYHMYLSLLSDVVHEENENVNSMLQDVKIEFGLNANLPDYYVQEQSNRMQIYGQISKLSSLEEKQEFVAKLELEYGTAPEALLHLCTVAILKNLAMKNGIVKVVINKNGAKLQFESVEKLMREEVVKLTNKYKNDFVINLESLPIINLKKLNQIEQSANLVIKFLLELQNAS